MPRRYNKSRRLTIEEEEIVRSLWAENLKNSKELSEVEMKILDLMERRERLRYEIDKVSLTSLANRFNVSKAHISNLIRPRLNQGRAI